MSIPAQRFKFLDKETNIPVLSMLSVDNSDIYNSPNLAQTPLSKDIEEFFANSFQSPKIGSNSIRDTTVRQSKDALGALKDLGNIKPNVLDKSISGMISNPSARAAFNTLSDKCKTKGMSNFNLGKPYDTGIDCNGKTRKGAPGGCSVDGFGNVLNKLTDGQYTATHTDLNSALRNLISLSSFGYNMNMCGVFTALGGNLNKDVLSRASGALLGSLGSSSNTLGVFDLAGASAGLHTVLENPSGIRSVFNNFKLPGELKESTLSNTADRLTGSMELLDEQWAHSNVDGLLSTKFADYRNSDVNDTLMAKVTSISISENDLDTPRDDDDAYLAVAYGQMGEREIDYSTALA